MLSDGAVATYDAKASDLSAGALVFNYKVKAADYATDLKVLGVALDGATITGARGGAANFSLAADDDLALDVNAADRHRRHIVRSRRAKPRAASRHADADDERSGGRQHAAGSPTLSAERRRDGDL